MMQLFLLPLFYVFLFHLLKQLHLKIPAQYLHYNNTKKHHLQEQIPQCFTELKLPILLY